jgi:hypothetical protein
MAGKIRWILKMLTSYGGKFTQDGGYQFTPDGGYQTTIGEGSGQRPAKI